MTGQFKTLSLGDGLFTIQYVPMPTDKPCENCLAKNNLSLCLQLPDNCLKEKVSYVKRLEVIGDCE